MVADAALQRDEHKAVFRDRTIAENLGPPAGVKCGSLISGHLGGVKLCLCHVKMPALVRCLDPPERKVIGFAQAQNPAAHRLLHMEQTIAPANRLQTFALCIGVKFQPPMGQGRTQAFKEVDAARRCLFAPRRMQIDMQHRPQVRPLLVRRILHGHIGAAQSGFPMADDKFPGWHGTTILAVRRGGMVVVAGDGQVSLGNTVIKGTARKVRRLSPGGHDVVAGFAGSTADAFTLLERLEKKLDSAPGQLARACVDLAKDWRMDKYLRNLEAMLIVTNGRDLYVITGAGDVLEPEHDVAAIGSGGNFALAAARGLMTTDLLAEDIARRAMAIAADICVFTNGKLTVETIKAPA